MKRFKEYSPEWVLRIGFAAMYFYSGFNILSNPSGWTWAVPGWFSNLTSLFFTIETYLQIQALGEIAFAVCFLLWVLPAKFLRYVAFLAAIEMGGILFFGNGGVNSITFRDFGLFGGLVALSLMFQIKSREENRA